MINLPDSKMFDARWILDPAAEEGGHRQALEHCEVSVPTNARLVVSRQARRYENLYLRQGGQQKRAKLKVHMPANQQNTPFPAKFGEGPRIIPKANSEPAKMFRSNPQNAQPQGADVNENCHRQKKNSMKKERKRKSSKIKRRSKKTWDVTSHRPTLAAETVKRQTASTWQWQTIYQRGLIASGYPLTPLVC